LPPEWPDVAAVVLVGREREVKGQRADTAHYYVTSLRGTAAELGRLIRRHWSVENELHWCLDVAFREDANKTAAGHAGANLGLVRRVTYLNMAKSQARKDSAALFSAPLLGLVTSRSGDRATQVRAGQVFQRVALLAAASGVWTQPVSQIVQVPECKEELARLLPTPGEVPLHPFRLGYAPPERHHTPRRALDEVLV
jgi:hypothetical protein